MDLGRTRIIDGQGNYAGHSFIDQGDRVNMALTSQGDVTKEKK
jgi:hypothetical protein